LRVTLFSWIPERASFASWIERDFEARNPDIDLIVRDPNKADAGPDLAYDYEKTVEALTKDGEDAQDLIEVDTMILGYLHEQRAIAPLEVKASYLDFAQRAVTINGHVVGVPHWTCGYFVISEADLHKAADREQLLAILKALKNDSVTLVGDLDGSWDSIMVYLDTLRDSDPATNLETALTATTIDTNARMNLEAIGAACMKDGKSMCADADAAVSVFAQGKASGLVGYSERLHPILTTADVKVDRAKLHIASAILGNGNHPMLFTDALVQSPRCTGSCLDAARRFAAYYVSDETFETALMSRDTDPSAVPRYLLPSTTTAFETTQVAHDRLYQELKTTIRDAVPFPTSGVPAARKAGLIRKQVKTALGIP
jgi:thiamine pyridinylase